jgi:hypothetical protein
MRKLSQEGKAMTHANLVHAATDLISEMNGQEQWLNRYDAALASSNDQDLAELVSQLGGALHSRFPLAA